MPEREKIALLFAELLITSPESVTDSFFEEVRLHFSPAEILEMCYYVLYYNIPHRYASALHVDPPDGDNLKVQHIQQMYGVLPGEVAKQGNRARPSRRRAKEVSRAATRNSHA